MFLKVVVYTYVRPYLKDLYNITLFYWLWQAEELMRKIEKEEERVAYDQPDKKVYHLCIVNLVIGYVSQVAEYFISWIERLIIYYISTE